MAKEVFEQKNPKPAPLVPHPNGSAVVPRVPTGRPEKHRSGGGLWIVLGLILLTAIAAGVYYYVYLPQNQATDSTAKTGKHGGASDKIRVVPATATKGDIGVYIWGLGNVTPLKTVTVKTRVDGQLMKVLFTEGQMVKEGDLLVQLDTRPFEAQLAQQKAQMEHDQALLDNAKIDLQRYETLLKQDSIQAQTRDTQVSLVKQDQGTVDSDQAQIVATQLNITYCNVTAPVSGRVGLRLVDEGNQVHASDANGLLVIAQLQPITVVFTIPEDEIPAVMAKLNAGQQLTVEAWDRDKTTKLADGTLLTIDNQIESTTGTLQLKAIFPNENNSLFPNQFVNAKLQVEMKKGVVVLPVAAIQYGTQGTFVYLVDDSDPKAATVSMKNVKVGTIDDDGNKAEIQSGIDEGDVVVIDGVDKLTNGAKIILSTGDDSKKPGGTTADTSAAPGT